MLEEDTGNIVLVDSGSPTKDFEDLSNPEVALNMPKEKIEGFLRRIVRVKKIETFMNLSDEERNQLDIDFGISTKETNELILQTERKLKEIVETKRERRRQEIDKFLDTVFGKKDVVSGNDIVRAVMGIMGKDKIPEKTQKTIDRIKDQKNIEGDKQYWIEQIVQQERKQP